jgi:hypothetical protein
MMWPVAKKTDGSAEKSPPNGGRSPPPQLRSPSPASHSSGLLNTTHQTLTASPAVSPLVWIVNDAPWSVRTRFDHAPAIAEPSASQNTSLWLGVPAAAGAARTAAAMRPFPLP